jgi:hypothetical protein
MNFISQPNYCAVWLIDDSRVTLTYSHIQINSVVFIKSVASVAGFSFWVRSIANAYD